MSEALIELHKKGSMSALLRFLKFSFLIGTFLISVLLCAEEPPLTPPLPHPNNAQLEALGSRLFGSKATDPQVNAIEIAQPQSIRTVKKTDSDQLVPPKPIKQASFATFPVSQLPEESVYKELPPESFPEYEQMDSSNEMLDKPLSSKKSAKTKGESTEGENENEKIKIGGWKHKLTKPELSSQLTPVLSVAGSLLIVIAAFFLLAILLRKVSPKGNRPLPKEAFECLGRYFLTQKHQVQLLRLGNRIVLVSVMPDGVSTLAEITDPDEAVSLLGLCRRLDTHSATEMFRKTIASMSENELSRPPDRPVVTARRNGQQRGQPTASLDLYSDPDESLAAILARGRHSGR